jgi:hypothetical protein
MTYELADDRVRVRIFRPVAIEKPAHCEGEDAIQSKRDGAER